jgi:excinuclease UvrABC nuclease subunit
MIKFNKTEINEHKIPSGTGIFTLLNANKILYINKTSDLDKSIRQLFKVAKDDKNIFQLVSQTAEIAYEEHISLFAALVHQKKLESSSYSEFNSIIKLYEQYVYLGIDFDEPPFVKVVEDTQEQLFYIGPFKDRFFLFDLLDAMAELFQFPLCPDEKPYPCSRYKNNKCPGWCIKEKSKTYTKAILPYIIPNEDILSSKQKEYNKYFDDLQFEKAEKLKNKIQLVEKYLEYLKFINITKNLDLEFNENGRDFIVKDGRLNGLVENGKNDEFPLITVELRDNEILAFNKDQLAERWIVYKYLINKNDKIILDRINEFYKKLQLKIRLNLT